MDASAAFCRASTKSFSSWSMSSAGQYIAIHSLIECLNLGQSTFEWFYLFSGGGGGGIFLNVKLVCTAKWLLVSVGWTSQVDPSQSSSEMKDKSSLPPSLWVGSPLLRSLTPGISSSVCMMWIPVLLHGPRDSNR